MILDQVPAGRKSYEGHYLDNNVEKMYKVYTKHTNYIYKKTALTLILLSVVIVLCLTEYWIKYNIYNFIDIIFTCKP